MASKSTMLLSIVIGVCAFSWQTQGQGHPSDTSVPFLPLPIPLPPPIQVCPVCDRLTNGFGVGETNFIALVAQLGQAQSKVETCTSSVSSNLKIVLSAGTSSPGNYENAVCPDGYILADCQCTRKDNECDGVFITSNGRRCRSRKPDVAGTANFRTIGTCVPDNGNIIITRTPTFTVWPAKTCPVNYKMIACVLENKGTTEVNTVITGNTCNVNGNCGTTEDPKCRISAVCKKV